MIAYFDVGVNSSGRVHPTGLRPVSEYGTNMESFEGVTMTGQGKSGRGYDLTEEDRRKLAEILDKIERLAEDWSEDERWRRELEDLRRRVGNRLGKQPSKEERLSVYRGVRQAGILPDEAAFFLVAYTIEWIAEDRIASAFQDRMREAEKIEDVHEFKRLISPRKGEEIAIVVDTFREYGEPDMGELYRRNRTEYERIKEVGRRYFFG
jgi:hypothetical protein